MKGIRNRCMNIWGGMNMNMDVLTDGRVETSTRQPLINQRLSRCWKAGLGPAVFYYLV